jgi:hypothetical protein
MNECHTKFVSTAIAATLSIIALQNARIVPALAQIPAISRVEICGRSKVDGLDCATITNGMLVVDR